MLFLQYIKCVTPNLKSEQDGVAVNAVPLPVSNGGRVVPCPVFSVLQYRSSAGVISEDNDRFRSMLFA
jgi:hypothetical protein